MTDLAEWLEAQIAEDERRARAACHDRTEIDRLSRQPIRTVEDDGVWSVGEHAMDECNVDGIGIRIYGEGGHTREQAVHIATWDPARVLAECAAKRRVIDEHHKVEEYADPITFCSACGGHPSHGSDWPCYTLRLLALPYADRSGFRDEWRPR